MRNLTEVIKEVETIKDSLGKSIEPAVRDLVIGLRRWGIETEMSCEGHEDGIKYPWIDVSLKSVQQLVKLLGIWWKEKENNIPASDQPKWLIKSFAGMIRIFPEDKEIRSLQEMQEDAKNFGKFLQEIPDNFFKEEE